MKKLRLILMALGAPALLLLGVHEFAGTPISKGYETGFEWHADPSNRLVLNADAGGNVTCWLVLEMPAKIQGFKAETSAGTHLRTYQKSLSGSTQMVAIVKDTAAPETPFDWPSGSSLVISPQDGSSAASSVIGDWYVYLSNKTYDSQERTKWRKRIFWISIVLLSFGLIATTIEAVEKARVKEEPREPFSAEYCLKQLIKRVEGADADQTQQMQTLLQKVLIEGVDLRDATAPWQMITSRKLLLQKKAFKSLEDSLGRLVTDLPKYLLEIQKKKRLPS